MSRNTLVSLVFIGVVAVVAMLNAQRAVPTAAPAVANGDLQEARTRTIAGPGRVEAVSEEIEIATEVPGRLREVRVDEGDRVSRGDVIAVLDNADAVARVASAEAALAVAEAERLRLVNGARAEERREAQAAVTQAEAVLLNAEQDEARRRALVADGVVAREELDRAVRERDVARARLQELRERAEVVDSSARADERARADAAVAVARARLAEARASHAKTIVTAPIDGVVVKRDRHPGEIVSPESPASAVILTVADTRVLRVRVDVDEIDVARLAVGQRAYVTAGAYGTRRFGGRVVRVGERLGRKNVRTEEPSEKIDTKVLETLVELDRDVRLPLGLRVDASIDGSR